MGRSLYDIIIPSMSRFKLNVIHVESTKTVTKGKYVTSKIHFMKSTIFFLQKELKLLSFYPQKSIQAGGKKITIVGQNIGFPRSVYSISFCSDNKQICVPCR